MNVKGEKKKSSKMYTAFTVDEYLIDSMKKKSAGLSLFFMSSKGMEMHRPEEKKSGAYDFSSSTETANQTYGKKLFLHA